MNPSSEDCSPVDSIRKAGISRRGGVRVRGGRLPPIRIRNSSQITTPSKKVVAPKIPQRRLKVKDETQNSYQESQTGDNRRNYEPSDSRQKSSQGRGRGSKVYLQSEGTFLGEGPAIKVKKEVQTSSYERGPRGSRSKAGETKFDPSRLKYLFEDYDKDEPYDDSLHLPVRFPILKQEVKREIKQEIKDEVKIEIKEEIKDEGQIQIKEEIKDEDLDVDDIKRFIKKEPQDSEPEETKVVEKVEISEKEKSYPFDDDIQFMKGEDTFILLQLPSFLPFKKAPGNCSLSTGEDKSSKAVNSNEESEAAPLETDLKSLREGHLGKLQILRSGKMRLVSGSVTMSIERTMEVPTLFEVVSIPVVENSREDGDIVVLGRIGRKLILRPLLDNITVESVYKNDVY